MTKQDKLYLINYLMLFYNLSGDSPKAGELGPILYLRRKNTGNLSKDLSRSKRKCQQNKYQ